MLKSGRAGHMGGPQASRAKKWTGRGPPGLIASAAYVSNGTMVNMCVSPLVSQIHIVEYWCAPEIWVRDQWIIQGH